MRHSIAAIKRRAFLFLKLYPRFYFLHLLSPHTVRGVVGSANHEIRSVFHSIYYLLASCSYREVWIDSQPILEEGY